MENFNGPKLGGFCGTIASLISLYELYGSWLLFYIDLFNQKILIGSICKYLLIILNNCIPQFL